MVTSLILVCEMCRCNMYVIPRSISRKDLGYKDYENKADATVARCPYLLLPMDSNHPSKHAPVGKQRMTVSRCKGAYVRRP